MRNLKQLILVFVITMVLVILLILGSKYFNSEEVQSIIDIIATIIAIGSFTFTIAFSYNTLFEDARQKEKEKDSNRIKNAVFADSKDSKKSSVNALTLMQLNLENMNEFYTWSQRQAKAAFWCSIIMSALGFLLIAAAILLAIIVKPDTIISAIPAVGGIVIELLATTIMIIYRQSLPQLNHYHTSLHEDERFLSSINLIPRLSTQEAQDEMLREIIRSELQMNLSKSTARAEKDSLQSEGGKESQE